MYEDNIQFQILVFSSRAKQHKIVFKHRLVLYKFLQHCLH
jgi:hypothetical protein